MILETLQINNFALIEKVDIDFFQGLNVLSGESGAGKSLVINAIKLLLGRRADKGLIRQGEQTIELVGLFSFVDNTFVSQRIKNKLDSYGVSIDQGQLIIRRLVGRDKSRSYINTSLVPLKIIDELGSLLLDVYAPGQSFKLLKNSYQCELLDSFVSNENFVGRVIRAYHLWQELEEEKKQLLGNIPNQAELEVFEHQLKDISQLDINLEKDKDLIKQFNQASNAQELLQICQQSSFNLKNSESSLEQNIHLFSRTIESLKNLDENFYNQCLEKIAHLLENINELAETFESYQNTLTLDPEHLQYLNDRMEKLNSLKRKFGGSLESVLQYKKKIEKKVSFLKNYDQNLEQLDEKIAIAYKTYLSESSKLTKSRCQAAIKLADKIQKQLKELGFSGAKFQIKVSEKKPAEKGVDFVEFFITTNVGEVIKPLNLISSGEISRIMLAIKSASAHKADTPILIFDEIDVNIGGLSGMKVAQKINSLSDGKQIFSITHLPQVAASAHQHYLVEKKVVKKRTKSQIKLLNSKGRLQELSRMLGGIESSNQARSHALELLEHFK